MNYERLLASEGLAALPDVVTQHDHAGWHVEDEAHTEESAAEMDRRRGILRAGGFSREDRAVWDLYSQGHGRPAIAKRLRLTDAAARASIARTETRAALAASVRGDGKGLRRLVRKVESGSLLRLVSLMLVAG